MKRKSSSNLIHVGAQLDEQTDDRLDLWAKREGRSKRRQAAIVLRKVTSLLDSHADDLRRLGLIDTPAGRN